MTPIQSVNFECGNGPAISSCGITTMPENETHSTFDGLPGCTDSTALNYNPLATDNDGSCVYGCDPVRPAFIADGRDLSGQSKLHFDASYSQSSSGDPIVLWRWDYGDGSAENEIVPVNHIHTFPAPGIYNVALTTTTQSILHNTLSIPTTVGNVLIGLAYLNAPTNGPTFCQLPPVPPDGVPLYPLPPNDSDSILSGDSIPATFPPSP